MKCGVLVELGQKKLKSLEVYSIGQFLMMNDSHVRKLMNVNGLRTKLELLECIVIKLHQYLKQNEI